MAYIVDERDHNTEITLYTEKIVFPKNKNNSLYIELAQLQFPDYIIECAINIHKSMNIPTKRGRNRIKLKFILIYYAYKSMGIIYDSNKLANYFGIHDTGEIIRTFSKFSPGKTGYDFPDLDADPEDFIKEYYTSAGIINGKFEDFKIFADHIFKKINTNNIDHEYYPQIIAAATVIYYLKINGIDNISHFCEKIYRSEIALAGASKLIEGVYNS